MQRFEYVCAPDDELDEYCISGYSADECGGSGECSYALFVVDRASGVAYTGRCDCRGKGALRNDVKAFVNGC